MYCTSARPGYKTLSRIALLGIVHPLQDDRPWAHCPLSWSGGNTKRRHNNSDSDRIYSSTAGRASGVQSQHATTPIVEGLCLVPTSDEFESLPADVTAYKRFTGSIQWLVGQTRPGIIQAMAEAAQCQTH